MKKQTIPNLEQIQQATVYHRQTLRVASSSIGLDIPLGAKTALLVFQSIGENPTSTYYLEGNMESSEEESWIPATDGTVKELIGYEMRTFRAKSTGKFPQIIHVSYTK